MRQAPKALIRRHLIRAAGQSVPTQHAGEVQRYYDEMTPTYLQGFGEVFQGSRPDSTEELLSYLLAAADLQDGHKVLDAGCGVCGPAVWLAQQRSLTVEALTISSVQVATARKLIAQAGVGRRVRVAQGDFHRLSSIYAAESFDRVMFLESLCHAEDYRQVLTEARIVLKTGGAIYIKDFFALDNRSQPHLQAQQNDDLASLNDLYRLTLPHSPTVVDLISELGFSIRYMRRPTYSSTYTHWSNYERLAGAAWNPTSGDPGLVIEAVEFFGVKR